MPCGFEQTFFYFDTMAIVLLGTLGRKPFAELSANEVISAELFIIPPKTTITLTDKEDIAELTDILNESLFIEKIILEESMMVN